MPMLTTEQRQEVAAGGRGLRLYRDYSNEFNLALLGGFLAQRRFKNLLMFLRSADVVHSKKFRGGSSLVLNGFQDVVALLAIYVERFMGDEDPDIVGEAIAEALEELNYDERTSEFALFEYIVRNISPEINEADCRGLLATIDLKLNPYNHGAGALRALNECPNPIFARLVAEEHVRRLQDS